MTEETRPLNANECVNELERCIRNDNIEPKELSELSSMIMDIKDMIKIKYVLSSDDVNKQQKFESIVNLIRERTGDL